jgi:hypothetical protein
MTMDAANRDVSMVKEYVAQQRKKPSTDVEVKVLAQANVPHTTVFRARLLSERGRPGSFTVGIVSDGKIITGFDQAAATIAKEWSYGAKRSVPAEKMALVLGWLEGVREPSQAITTTEQLDVVQPAWQKFMYLPKETTVEGHPAVQYWVQAPGERPAWESQAVFLPDGTVKLRIKEIWDFVSP